MRPANRVARFCREPRSIAEVAEFLGISRQWARTLVLKSCRPVGRVEGKPGKPGFLYQNVITIAEPTKKGC